MIDIGGLSGELADLAKTIGLLKDDGGFNAAWFNNPLTSLETVLSNEPQRRALLRLLDALLPPLRSSRVPTGEKWHPLLAAGQPGNLYLTVRDTGGGVLVGLSADYGTDGPPVAASIGASVALVRAGSSVAVIAGSDDGPLTAQLRVTVNIVPAAGGGITLRAVAVKATVSDSGVALHVVLEGLSLAGEPAVDRELDPATLGADVPDLVAALLKHVVAQDPVAAAAVSDAVGLLGLADNTIPAFPFAQVASDPGALQRWLSSLFDASAGAAPVEDWLRHFAGLFRSLFGALPAPERLGTSDAYSIALVPFDPSSQLRLSIVRRDATLRLGVALRFAAVTAGVRFGLEAGAAFVDLPLAGTARARVLPEAFATLTVDGAGGTRLVPLGESRAVVPADANLHIGALVAGLVFEGATFRPRLELQDVRFTSVAYPVLDLTHTDSVAAAASAVVTAAINAALGQSTIALRLAALAGLVPPRDPANPALPLLGWPHAVDAGRLVTDPTGAIAAVHRAALRDPAFGWQRLFGEIASLVLGDGTVVSGIGSVADPWRATLGASGALTLELSAYDAQTDAAPAAPRRLRIGLRLAAGVAPLSFTFTSDVLSFDLPASGAAQVGFVGAQRMRLALEPALAGSLLGGDLRASIAAFFAELAWAPDAPLAWAAGASGLHLEAFGDTFDVPSIGLPAAAGFDLTNPAAAAASFGLTPATLERLLSVLVAQAAAQLPAAARDATALIGLHRQGLTLPADWPLWADPAQGGRLLTDPLAAARSWVQRVTIGIGADGRPHALRWISALIDSLRDREDEDLELPGVPRLDPLALIDLDGAGTYEEPWVMPLPGAIGDTAQVEFWLGPAGPPTAWATGIGVWLGASTEFFAAVAALRGLAVFEAPLRMAMHGRGSEMLSDALGLVSELLLTSDAVVPLASQQPQIDGWTLPDPIAGSHLSLPTTPAVVAEVGARVDAIAGGAGAPRVVLLLAPALAGADPWGALLAAGSTNGTKDPGAVFALDDRTIPNPLTFPLSGTTAVVDWYVARLPDDDIPDWDRQSQLIGRIVSRLAELRPGQLVTLVAHSTLGIAARHYAASHRAQLAGLVTLGTPHLGANLPFLLDPDIADALRVLQALAPDLPADAATAPLRAAIAGLVEAIDGYAAPAGAGTLPERRAFPFAAFDPTGANLDLGTLPVVAIAGVAHNTGLLPSVIAAGQALAVRIGARAVPAPTHLGAGVSLALDLGETPDVELTASARVRIDVLQLPFTAGAVPPARPAQGLRFAARLYRRGGWLLGGPSTLPEQVGSADPRLAFVDVRLREVTLGLDAAKTAAGVQATPWLRLHQAALHGPTLPVVRAGESIASGVLGELFQSLSAGLDVSAGPLPKLIDALQAIGIVGPDPHGGVALLDDAWRSLQADAIGYLGARFAALLEAGTGWLGIQGPSEGPWVWSPGSAPIDLVVAREANRGPWSLALRARAEADSDDMPLAIAVQARVALPSLAATAGLVGRVGAVRVDWDGATLGVTATPWLDRFVLLPAPAAATLRAELERLWPRLLFSGVASAVLGAFAPALKLRELMDLLLDAGGFLQRTLASAEGFSVAKVRELLGLLARALGGPADGTVTLPANLRLSAAGAGSVADPLRLQLESTAPVGGVLGFALGASIDPARHVTPQGTVDLTLPLAAGTTWGQLGVRFGVGAAGVNLTLLPGNGIAPIQLLPTFSGLGALRGAAEALLPRVLDELVASFGNPRPGWLTSLLSVAQAIDIADGAGLFTPRTAQLRALLEGDWFAAFDNAEREAIAQASVALLQLLPALPFTAARDGGRVRLTIVLPPGVSGTVGVAAGFDAAGPSIGVTVDDLVIANAVAAKLVLDAGSAGVSVQGRIGAVLRSVGVPLTPRIDFTGNTAAGGFTVTVRPIAAGIGDAQAGPLALQLAPTFAATFAADSIERLLTDWALPLVANTLLQVARDQGLLARKLWSTGPTLESVLTGSTLFTAGGGGPRLAAPLPSIDSLVFNTVRALANGVTVPLGDLSLTLLAAERIGLALKGEQKIPLGDLELKVLFGAPASWAQRVGADAGTPGAADGLKLYLLRDNTGTLEFDFGVELAGVGVGLFGSEGRALLDDPSVRIGGVAAHLFIDFETHGAPVRKLGGGLRLVEFGLPLGALTGGATANSNPVVGALLSQGGSGGDASTPAPATDVEVWFVEGDRLHLRMGGESEALWIGVHSQFGPIYIDQVGVRLTSVDAGLLVDGGVSLAGFSAQVDDLALIVPYRTAGDVATWKLDLKGLGLGFSQPGISIAGALVKYEPPIEYNGMLLIKIGTIGAIAVGSYSVPVEANGEKFTSLAIFGGVFVPIGITPIINLTALGLGVGLNRRLVVPEDLNQIPGFFLVQALDRPEEFANNPLGALLRFRAAVPAKRGAFWLAAGLRGTSFEIVHVTAVLYVALDRGVEVGLLGLARAALPADEAALVSVELALKARFSTAEGLFSVQAQLTDNSWLLSRDCQLTGGFAFFVWFKRSQFLLTLGGYHPAFQKLPEYPDVPRLGYRWNLLGVIHIKGESYFALTNTCVMAGTRLEVTYGPDWVQLWFTSYADFLAQWDPFYFRADIGVAVGARFRIRVCFFACVTISVSVSVGAELHLEGPPLHGSVTVDLAIASVTVPFGPNARPKPEPLDWPTFKLKYLQASDPATLPVSAQVGKGLLPPEPPGAPVAPGTETQPWKLAAEWTFQSETRMPATSFVFVADVAAGAWNPAGAARFGRFGVEALTADLDIGPMSAENVDSCHRIFIEKRVGNAWQRMSAAELDTDRFILEPIIGQVSEAAYRTLGDEGPPAAANTLPVLVGLRIEGISELRSTTPDVIPIAKLRDATNPRPLPFAKPDSPIFVDIRVSGVAADGYLVFGSDLSHGKQLEAAVAVLSGDQGLFADQRVASGVRRGGIGPVASRALLERRSAAPLVAPLSAGLSMNPVEQDIAPTAGKLAPAAPVALSKPRLAAVLQPRSAATEPAPPTLRTTVSERQRKAALATVHVRSELRREVTVSGARLDKRSAPNAPVATRFVNAATSVRSQQIGAAGSILRNETFAKTEEAAATNGTLLRAGVTQVWDVPFAQKAIAFEGDQAVRVTLLSRGGAVLSDAEYGSGRAEVALPDRCAAVAVTGLGRLFTTKPGDWQVAPGPGAVTAFSAPAGRAAATGWQSSDQAVQLNASTLLVRGAVLRLSERGSVGLHGQSLTQAVVPLAQVVGATTAVQMQLTPYCSVLAVLLDATTARLPGDDDLVLGVRNATVDELPVRAGGGQRAVLMFDLTPDPKATANGDVPVIVSAQSAQDVRISGVVALAGTAREWGERLNGSLPEDWVPDEPLSADGTTTVRFIGG